MKITRQKFFSLACLLLVLSCGGTDVESGFSIDTNTGAESGDVDAPTVSGVITVATDSGSDSAGTATWPDANDDTGLDYYSLAINVDDGNGTCGSEDFNGSLTLEYTKVPGTADNTGSGYQISDGGLDGDNGTISLTLLGSQNYCMAITATDNSGNTSTPIYSSSVFEYKYRSCKEKLDVESGTASGVYEIDPDGVGGSAAYDAYCDMSTQGGGWTLVIKYDINQATGADYALPTNAGRTEINASDLENLDATGNLAATHNIIPFVEAGATHFMHVGKDNGVGAYNRIYFSEIYQAVIDTPSNLFDSALDSNDNDGVIGTVVSGTSAVRKDRWFESDFTVMTVFDTDGDTSNNYRINGGEGDAMFVNGDREGALYATAASSNGGGHGDPKVQWGFRGQDGTQQTYGGNIHIGTYCSNSNACAPESQINLMFVR